MRPNENFSTGDCAVKDKKRKLKVIILVNRKLMF